MILLGFLGQIDFANFSNLKSYCYYVIVQRIFKDACYKGMNNDSKYSFDLWTNFFHLSIHDFFPFLFLFISFSFPHIFLIISKSFIYRYCLIFRTYK